MLRFLSSIVMLAIYVPVFLLVALFFIFYSVLVVLFAFPSIVYTMGNMVFARIRM